MQADQVARYWSRRSIVGLCLLGALLALYFFGLPWPLNYWLQGMLLTAIQIYVGWPFYAGAARGLARRSLGIDLLIAVGTSVCYVVGIAKVFHGEGGHPLAMAAIAGSVVLVLATLWRYRSATEGVRST